MLSTGLSEAQLRTPSQVEDHGINPPSGSKVQEAEFRRAHEAYVRGDYDTAIRIWNQLADQGHIKSMNNLGAMYSQGRAVPRNYPLARLWYRRAAAAGGPRANYNLGMLYEYGRGVEPSDAEAAKYYRTAAKLGVIDAMDALAWLLATSPDILVRDAHEARLWANYSLARNTTSRSLSTLAAVQAELGEYNMAVETIERAIDYLKREINGADMVRTERDNFLLLRQEGRTEDVATLLERQEYYRNGQPTRD